MKDYNELIKKLRNAAGGDLGRKMCREAADVIEQLARDNNDLTKERDAAVMDLKAYSDCDNCKHNTYDNLRNGFCRECSVVHKTKYKWQWRGAQEVDDG